VKRRAVTLLAAATHGLSSPGHTRQARLLEYGLAIPLGPSRTYHITPPRAWTLRVTGNACGATVRYHMALKRGGHRVRRRFSASHRTQLTPMSSNRNDGRSSDRTLCLVQRPALFCFSHPRPGGEPELTLPIDMRCRRCASGYDRKQHRLSRLQLLLFCHWLAVPAMC
jgi:hypothetical protein